MSKRREADDLLDAYESQVEPFPTRDEVVELLALGLQRRAEVEALKRNVHQEEWGG